MNYGRYTGGLGGVGHRYEEILEEVAVACGSCGRNPAEVTVVVVSKGVSVDLLRAAYDAGARHFGESRLQEALPKIADLPTDIVWHFIGPLQANKARRIAEKFQVVHSFDKLSHAAEIEKSGSKTEVLVQVNLTGEPQKRGIFADALDETVFSLAQCGCIRFRGLMTIGQKVLDSELGRETYGRLAQLGRAWDGCWLSMGMSDDFAVAIQEGATHVRIGSRIFRGEY